MSKYQLLCPGPTAVARVQVSHASSLGSCHQPKASELASSSKPPFPARPPPASKISLLISPPCSGPFKSTTTFWLTPLILTLTFKVLYCLARGSVSCLLPIVPTLGCRTYHLPTAVHCFLPNLSPCSAFGLKCLFPTYVSVLNSRKLFVHHDAATFGRCCLSFLIPSLHLSHFLAIYLLMCLSYHTVNSSRPK